MHNRHRFTALLLTAAITAACSLSSGQVSACAFTESAVETQTDEVGYESCLFDETRIHEVNLVIPEEEWNDLVTTPTEKTKYKADIVIDGEEFNDISCSTKGNSSLSGVIRKYEGSSRFSLRINFGKYVDGQSYHGLKKLDLNNIYGDGTCMKNALIYDMFRQAGIPSPLASYVWLKINGEDHGLYLALEDLGKGFLNRTSDGKGKLYKTESARLASGGDMMSKIVADKCQSVDYGEGAELSYRGEDVASYRDIFEDTSDWDEGDYEDAYKVIHALKGLSEGDDLESCLDTSEIIRYFAVHNFVLNYDSYTGPCLHNYYLYERGGRLAIFPWDYNDSFGTIWALYIKGDPNDPTTLANLGIDTPLLGVTNEQRPMWKWIVENEEYLNEYHQDMDELISDYFESGYFEQKLDGIYNMIHPYLEKDPSAFVSVDQFNLAYQTLRKFASYRAQSIRRQLDGGLSTITDEQIAADRIDASDTPIANFR